MIFFSTVGPNVQIYDGFFTPRRGTKLKIFGAYEIIKGYFLREGTIEKGLLEMYWTLTQDSSYESGYRPYPEGTCSAEEWRLTERGIPRLNKSDPRNREE